MEVKIRKGSGKLQQIVEVGKHRLLADEPITNGGEDTGPTPHELLAAALGVCTAMTVTMYARRKEWQLEDAEVRVNYTKRDETFVLSRRIRYIGNLDAEQKARLTEIANKCPVHRTLSGKILIETEVE